MKKFFAMNFAADAEGAPGGAPAGGNDPAVSAAGQGNPTANDGIAPAAMPEGFPAQFWDDKSGAPKMPDFVASYNELVKSSTEHAARIEALPKKAEDYKLEVKLPQDFKLPDGLDIKDLKVDDNDPRVGPLRELALKHQLPQEVVDELIALDAQTQIAAFTKHDEPGRGTCSWRQFWRSRFWRREMDGERWTRWSAGRRRQNCWMRLCDEQRDSAGLPVIPGGL